MREACTDALPPGGRPRHEAEAEAEVEVEAEEAEAGEEATAEAEADEEAEEGDEDDEEATDYPLPGSRAGCDTCGREVLLLWLRAT